MNKPRKASAKILRLLAFNLKRLREERGWSQLNLARRCGFPKRYIVHIEQGRVNITLRNLEIVANVLKCSIRDLLAPFPQDGK